jgi:hypothetical protein
MASTETKLPFNLYSPPPHTILVPLQSVQVELNLDHPLVISLAIHDRPIIWTAEEFVPKYSRQLGLLDRQSISPNYSKHFKTSSRLFVRMRNKI